MLNWRISMFLLLAMILLIIPLTQNILFTYQSPLGSLNILAVILSRLMRTYRQIVASALLIDTHTNGTNTLFMLPLRSLNDTIASSTAHRELSDLFHIATCSPRYLHYWLSVRTWCGKECMGIHAVFIAKSSVSRY